MSGWTHTIDEYYKGGYEPEHYGVKEIYDSVLEALQANKNITDPRLKRKWIAVEILFFQMWWQDPRTSESQKNAFRFFLKNKNIEFAGGGYVMHDEIASFFSDDINQLTLGHRWIAENFGSEHLPRHAWQIDAQGHMSSTPVLFRMMGFDSLTINRIPQYIKDRMQINKSLEFFFEGEGIVSNSLSS